MMKKYIIKLRTFDDREMIFNVCAKSLMRAYEQASRKMFAKGFRACDYEFSDFEVQNMP